ncbi:MAG: TonB-dependent receptor [Niabella sp.]
MQLKYIFSFILLFIINALHANEDKPGLSGVVKDAVTQAPLPGATVVVPDLKLSTTTDANGIYRFNALPNGRLTVQVSYIGYRSKVETVIVAGASTHDFLLSQSVVENENVTVTGVSSATRLKHTPVQVSIISRKDIQQSVGTHLLDIAAREPGVSIVTTGPAIAKPFIRGLGYNRVVTINDGIRQEGQQWGDEHGLEVDEYSAQKIEILRGPASLMYGSDAIGGVINILTNTPVANNTVQANLQTSFSGNNTMFGQYANVAGNINGFNWNAYGSIKSAGDYKNKYDGNVLNSRFGEKNFGGYIGVNKSWGFSHLLFSHFNQKVGMVEGERDEEGKLVLDSYTLTRSLEKGRTPLVPRQGIQHTKIALDNSFMLNDGSRIAALIGFQQNQRKEFAEPDAPDEPEAFFDLKTINYNLAYHLQENNNWKVSLGINGMQQQNKNRADEAIIPDYGLFDFGIYGVASKTWGQTTLSGGLRYDMRSINSKSMEEEGEEKFNAFTKKFANFSASLGATHEINDHISLKANISRGFRAPNLSELAANGEHEGTNRYEIGYQNLESEISTSIDAGVEITTNHVDISVAPYFNYINNYIFYNRLLTSNGTDSLIDGVPAFQFNQQSATLTGIEARIDLHPHPLDWLHFENTFSFVRGMFTKAVDGSSNLPLIAPVTILTELRAEFPRVSKTLSNFYGKIEMNTVASQNNFFAGYETETATKGYVLFNAGIGSDVKVAGQKICSVSVGVQNIGDVAYQSHLSRLKYADENPVTGRTGVFNMGRNFNARLIIPLEWKL